MNTSQVTIKSYRPPEKRERSKLQQVKDKHRSFPETNKQDIPKDMKELKSMKYIDHAIAFLNEYTNINKKTTKAKYCKANHISHKSLNTGLKLLGHNPYRGDQNNVLLNPVRETRSKILDKTCIKSDQSRPVETKADQKEK